MLSTIACHLPEPANMSQAMVRVARWLRAHAPACVRFVPAPEGADLAVLHVIGSDALSYESPARATAVIQYCMKTAGGTREQWAAWWRRQGMVASYYDLSADVPEGTPFVHVPLGVDARTFRPIGDARRDAVMTSGYVAGPGAEAIEEAAIAAAVAGLRTFHLGPRPTGMGRPPARWRSAHGIPDGELALELSGCLWASGLRFVEGFELPALEGLMCGARPVMFDRPEARRWFDGHAVFVPERSGAELVGILSAVFSRPPAPVTPAERAEAARKFDWAGVAGRFWDAAVWAADAGALAAGRPGEEAAAASQRGTR